MQTSFPQYDLILFITRAQPIHRGHYQNIDQALSLSKRVLVVVGSIDIARDTRNPLTFIERKEMILSTYNYNPKLEVVGQRDYPYHDDLWAADIQKLVHTATGGDSSLKVGLIGHTKADTEYYLKMFPQWNFIECEKTVNISATDIRNAWFGGKVAQGEVHRTIINHVSPQVWDQMIEFSYGPEDQTLRATDKFEKLVAEYQQIQKIKNAWKGSPYEPIFTTVDALIVQSGHILVVIRGKYPGKDLLAMPGGYLNANERMEDGMLRELSEETKLKVPTRVLRGSIVGSDVYDYPGRSLRGRNITKAYAIKLADGPLPKVKGSDDAAHAMWMPIAEIEQNRDRFFEDHYHIIYDLLQRFCRR